MFWMIAALSENHLTSIEVAVEYKNLPLDKIVSNRLPTHLELGLKASGWDLLQAYYADQWKVSIDVERRSLNNMFNTNAELEYFSKQLPDGFEVKYVNPGVLYFELDRGSSRYLPLKATLDLDFAKLFEIAGPIVLDPDTVLVSGPSRIVDTMKSISTGIIAAKKLNHSLSGEINLQLPAGFNLSISQNRVRYAIPVDQFTESSVQIPIQRISADSGKMLLLSTNVQVLFRIQMQKINVLKDKEIASKFLVLADTNQINLSTMQIGLALTEYPSWAHNPRIEPDHVSFLFQK